MEFGDQSSSAENSEEYPLVLQLLSLPSGRDARLAAESNENADHQLASSYKTPHHWAVCYFSPHIEKFSVDGRLVYKLNQSRLIVIDLFLNTHVILEGPRYTDNLWDLDFVVLNSTNILVLSSENRLDYQALYRVCLLFNKGRYERQLLFEWNRTDAKVGGVVLTSITGKSIGESSAILQSCGGKILIGRLDLDNSKFDLDSILTGPFEGHPFVQLSDDKHLLRFVKYGHWEKIHVYDLKTGEWSEQQLAKPEGERPTSIYEFQPQSVLCWSKKFLYLRGKTGFESNEKFIIYCLDFETNKWTKLPVTIEIYGSVIKVLPIVNANNEDVGLVICSAHSFNTPGNSQGYYWNYNVRRFMFREPESLINSCWFKVQEYFSDYKGRDMFHLLQKQKPWKTIFSALFESMNPTKQLRF